MFNSPDDNGRPQFHLKPQDEVVNDLNSLSLGLWREWHPLWAADVVTEPEAGHAFEELVTEFANTLWTTDNLLFAYRGALEFIKDIVREERSNGTTGSDSGLGDAAAKLCRLTLALHGGYAIASASEMKEELEQTVSSRGSEFTTLCDRVREACREKAPDGLAIIEGALEAVNEEIDALAPREEEALRDYLALLRYSLDPITDIGEWFPEIDVESLKDHCRGVWKIVLPQVQGEASAVMAGYRRALEQTKAEFEERHRTFGGGGWPGGGSSGIEP